MKKTDKLYLLAFILSMCSMAVAVVLKLCGVTWFDSAPITTSQYTGLEYVVNTLLLIIQGFLMAGCTTWERPIKVLKKYVYLFLAYLMLYFIPNAYQVYYSLFVLVFIAFLVRPKATTISRFIIGMIYVTIVQQASMWIKYSIIGKAPADISAWTLIISSIDQFILFALFYYVVVKCGDKIAVYPFLGDSKSR